MFNAIFHLQHIETKIELKWIGTSQQPYICMEKIFRIRRNNLFELRNLIIDSLKAILLLVIKQDLKATVLHPETCVYHWDRSLMFMYVFISLSILNNNVFYFPICCVKIHIFSVYCEHLHQGDIQRGSV